MSDRRSPFVPNPLLSGFYGLCPLVAAANNLSSGFVLGLGAALTALVLAAIVPATRTLVPDRLRAPTSLGLAAALAILYGLAVQSFSPALSNGLGIYLPLLAVNSLSLHALRRGPDHGIVSGGEATTRYGLILKEALGYFVVATLFGAIREVIGLGLLTLPLPGRAGLRVELTDASPLRLLISPAGGFLLLGSLAALYRFALHARGRRIP